MRLIHAIFILLITTAVACDRWVEPDESGRDNTLPSHLTTLVDVTSGRLAEVSEILISRPGEVAVVDRMAHAVLLFDSTGHLVRSIGREGSGPAEFKGPRTAVVRGDTLVVVDEGNARIQMLSLTGAYLRSSALPPSPMGGHWALSTAGEVAGPTLGLDSALVRVFGPEGELARRIGRPVGAPSNMVRPRQMKRDLTLGLVPEIFLNTVEPEFGSGGTLWLVEPARATVEAFSLSTGVRLDSVLIVAPEFEDVRARFMQSNAELPGTRMAPPRFLLDGKDVSGQFWVLLAPGTGESPRMVTLAGDGTATDLGILTPPGAISFAVDTVNGWMYFGTDLAEVVRMRAPELRIAVESH